MTVKLKPCPFCGGEAKFRRKLIKTNGGWCDAVYVWCPTCEARSNRVLYNTKVHQNDGEYIEAAKAWNTRKPMDKVVEQLEEQKVQHTKLVDYEATRGTIAERMQQEKAVEVLDKAIEIVKGGEA